MNRQNQDRADKVAHVYKKSRKVRSADEVLKRALTDCMQEEANQVQKTRRTACIFKAVY